MIDKFEYETSKQHERCIGLDKNNKKQEQEKFMNCKGVMRTIINK
mgnify:CR=1 FL=1